MKSTLTISLLVLIFSFSQAQDFDVNLSKKHLKKIENAKDARSKLQKYRKYYTKDSLKAAKRMRKYWRQKSDSLTKAMRKDKLEKATNSYALNLPKADSTTPDSLKAIGLHKARNQLPGSGQVDEVQSRLKDITGGADLNRDSLKSYAGRYAQDQAEHLENRLAQSEELKPLVEQGKTLESLQQTPAKYKQQYEQYADPGALKDQGKSLAENEAADFFAQHAEQLQAVQKKISRLQKKYRSVLNSNDLSTAVKRTSLKGRPFRERLFIGGNFNINTLDPLSLDLSPQVGYKFNTRFVVGIGGTYRKTFADTLRVSPAIPAETYGYKAFTSYDVIKSFFAYAEYERMTREVASPNSDTNTTQWVDGLLLGVGRRFSIHPKVHMNMMVLYNFLHDSETAIYSRPWTLKFGFQLSEMALLKK